MIRASVSGKRKNAGILSQKSEFCETQSRQRWTIIQGKNPASERTFATELSVPNMLIRTHRDFENAAHPLIVIYVGNTDKHFVFRRQS